MRVTTTNWKKISALIIVGAVFALLNQVEAASQSDAIAVRILPNVNHDSIETWYTNQGYKGSPQSLIVDGYEAIRDGRTVFVNAANVDSGNWYKPTSLSETPVGRECKVKLAVDKITGAVDCNLDLFLNPNAYAEEFFGNIAYTSGAPYCATSKCSTMVNANKCRWVEGTKLWTGQCSIKNNSTKIYTNIYLISYNQESEEKTLDILGQLVSHWKFNSNMTESGRCSISNLNCQADSDCPTNYICSKTSNGIGSVNSFNKCVQSTNKTCLIDSDCPLNLFCDSLKARTIRDVSRLGKLNQLNKAIESFKQVNGGYPNLQSGTYVLGSSLSVWPSWKDTLSSQLGIGALVDPINALGSCDGYDAVTCWNDKTKSFVSSNLSLPAGSYAFNYTAAKNGVNYSLCSVFETGLLGYDTADQKISASACSINNNSGYNSNTAPYVESSYTGGESGKEFNGYVKIKDAEGDLVSWNLSVLSNTPWISGDWKSGTNLVLPVLQDTGDANQKRIYAPKAGKPGLYDMNLVLTDNRGASTTTKLTLNIVAANKPKIEAEDITYFVDPINPLKYTFTVEGSNSKPNFQVTSSNSNFSKLIEDSIKKATETSVGLNKSKIDFSFLLPTSIKISQDVVIPLLITATADNGLSSTNVSLTLKNEKPYLDFQCENMARLGAPYQIAGNSCFLGKQKSGNHTLTYSVSSSNNLYVNRETTSEDVYLKSDSVTGSIATSSIVKVTVANEYGASSEKSFSLKTNTFCGDGVKQTPNSEEQGGPYNNGVEDCDGLDGVWTETKVVSMQPDKQYACTTGLNIKSPYPILNNNSCVFKSAIDGGGYCGDGFCQYKVVNPNGQTVDMENCSNCSTDCGICVCTPKCTKNVCGSDGCGGSCGDCGDGEECISGSCCSSKADVQVSADNQHLTYFNNTEVASGTNWNSVQDFKVEVLEGNNLFAIKADDWAGDSYNLHGLSATLNVYGCRNKEGVSKNISMNTDSTSDWKCTEEKNNINLVNWNRLSYNDSLWPGAISLGNKGPVRGNSLPYNQIWAANETSAIEAAKTVYCRYSFSTTFGKGCVPNCNNRCAGDDGCGAPCYDNCVLPDICGGAGIQYQCGDPADFKCIPNCTNKCGGPDGCGHICANTCNKSYECEAPNYKDCKKIK